MRCNSSELTRIQLSDRLKKGVAELEELTGIPKDNLLEIALKIGLAVLIREIGTSRKSR